MATSFRVLPPGDGPPKDKVPARRRLGAAAGVVGAIGHAVGSPKVENDLRATVVAGAVAARYGPAARKGHADGPPASSETDDCVDDEGDESDAADGKSGEGSAGDLRAAPQEVGTTA